MYAFLNTWNQYYWPLLVTDSTEWRTTQVGIAVFRSSEIAVYNLQMAANLIVLFPTLILLILGQRQLVIVYRRGVKRLGVSYQCAVASALFSCLLRNHN